MWSAITATSSSWPGSSVRGAQSGPGAVQARRVAASSAPARVGAEMAPPNTMATRLRAWRRVIKSSCVMRSSSFDVPPDAGRGGVLRPHGLVALAVVGDFRRRVHDPHRPLQEPAADQVGRQHGKVRTPQLGPRLVRLYDSEVDPLLR